MSETPPGARSDAQQPALLGKIQPTSVAARGKGKEVATSEDSERSKQVILEFESPAAYQLALPIPRRSRFTLYIIFAMFFSLLMVTIFLPIDRVVEGVGTIVSLEPQIGVAALENSIVRRVKVQLGQVVRKGDVLIQLDPTTASADLTLYEDQVASLTQETRRLQAELDGRTYLSDGTRHGDLQSSLYTQRNSQLTSQLENYQQKIEALRGPVQQAESDIRGYNERLSYARVVEDKRRELERLQVGSQLNTLSASDVRAEMLRFREAARAVLINAQRTLDAMIAERDGFLEQWRATTAQSLKDQGDKLDQAIDSLQKARLTMDVVELRAPMDAIVLQVAPVNNGTVVVAGSQLIQLTPIDAPVEAEIIFSAQDAGYIIPGQRATVKFDTFPYTTHGTGTGKIRVLSPDSIRNPYNPITQPAGLSDVQQQLGMLFYKGRVSIEDLKLFSVPDGFRPTPGMAVTVDVLVGHRTFLEYMFTRVVPTVTEGFREP